MTTNEILLSHSEENDATAYPWWAIVKKAGLGQHAILNGPFFNRADAEEYLESHRYRYGKSALVWCFSGHHAPHLRQMYDNARAAKAEGTNPC